MTRALRIDGPGPKGALYYYWDDGLMRWDGHPKHNTREGYEVALQTLWEAEPVDITLVDIELP